MTPGRTRKMLAAAVAAACSAGFLASVPAGAFAQTGGEIQSRINEKAAELQQIKEQRDAISKTLESISASKNSLSNDIREYNANIGQLNLTIKAGTVNIKKLGYEIESLSGQIADLKDGIAVKKAAIERLVAEAQRNENDDLFVRLLRSKTLSESVGEIENATALGSKLAADVAELKTLRENYAKKIAVGEKKKNETEEQQKALVEQQRVIAAQKAEKDQLLRLTKSSEQLYAQQIKELDERQAAIANEIDEIEARLNAASGSAVPAADNAAFDYPVEGARITQCYGRTAFARKAYKSGRHNGIDFALPVGTPLRAMASGVVVGVGNNDRGTARWQKYAYGKHVLVQYANGLTSLYGHLSSASVSVGQTVKRGEIVGYSGNTGQSTGAHLHLTLFIASTVQQNRMPPAAGTIPVGATVNPVDYLPEIGASCARGRI